MEIRKFNRVITAALSLPLGSHLLTAALSLPFVSHCKRQLSNISGEFKRTVILHEMFPIFLCCQT